MVNDTLSHFYKEVFRGWSQVALLIITIKN